MVLSCGWIFDVLFFTLRYLVGTIPSPRGSLHMYTSPTFRSIGCQGLTQCLAYVILNTRCGGPTSQDLGVRADPPACIAPPSAAELGGDTWLAATWLCYHTTCSSKTAPRREFPGSESRYRELFGSAFREEVRSMVLGNMTFPLLAAQGLCGMYTCEVTADGAIPKDEVRTITTA